VRRLAAALLVLTVAALAAGLTWLLLDVRRLRDSEAAAAQALTAARSFAGDMMSYDYRTIDRDLGRARDHATGALAGHYRRLATTLAPEAKRVRRVQQAVVAEAGVESAGPDEVRVLVFLNMVTTSAVSRQDTPTQRVSQQRVRLVMVKTPDGWRIADLSTLVGDTPTP
jgi:Mce-associated membrane protein